MDNKQRLSDIQNRISGKSQEFDLIDIWDFLMASYNCWIPFKEFIKLDVELVDGLVERINKRVKKLNRNSR